jgi:RNA polymerase sigma-70 factor (ECF subfamily)
MAVTPGLDASYIDRDVDNVARRQLVEQARAGDGSAWETLYRQLYPRLRAYAIAHGGPSAADDLVNETMARAVAAIHRFRWESSGFDGWTFGILRRVCAEHHRRRTRDGRKPRFEFASRDTEPGERLEIAEDHEQIRRAFQRLSAGDQEVLELRLISCLSAEDTARVLGRSPAAVRTAQSRALANLRKMMDQR